MDTEAIVSMITTAALAAAVSTIAVVAGSDGRRNKQPRSEIRTNKSSVWQSSWSDPNQYFINKHCLQTPNYVLMMPGIVRIYE